MSIEYRGLEFIGNELLELMVERVVTPTEGHVM